MHANDSWISLLVLFVVFVLLPQLTKFIKPRPENTDADAAEPGTLNETFDKSRQPNDFSKAFGAEALHGEPSARPIKPGWF